MIHVQYQLMQVELSDWIQQAKCLQENGSRFVTLFAEPHCQLNGGVLLRAIWAPAGGQPWEIVETQVKEEVNTFPSIVQSTPAALWHELEIRDLFGIERMPDDQPGGFVLHRPPAVGSNELQIGPVWGEIESAHRFSLSVEENRISSARLVPFSLHRGVEKSAEGQTLEQGLSIAERTCGSCTVAHVLAYALAVEHTVGMRVKPRQTWIRMLVSEMERLTTELSTVATLLESVGFQYGVSVVARGKEELRELHQRVFGHRFLRGVITLGGVAFDVTADQIDDIVGTSSRIIREIDGMLELAAGNDLVVNPFQGLGSVSADKARAFGAVGIVARASGVPRDVRKDMPYLYYSELDWEISIEGKGDAWSRFRLLARETSLSDSLIRQIGERLKSSRESADQVFEQAHLEPSANHFAQSKGLAAVEAPFGELVYFVTLSEQGHVKRMAIRTPSYVNARCIELVSPGISLSDFPLFSKSFGLCYACIDR